MSLLDLQKIIDSGTKLTPMMDQYYQIKKNYPETLLLFRMGDFYEVFFEDAKTAARLLNITLTHRGKIGDTPIPMAGIPHHAASTYIDRLTNMGLKIAICEQVENPKEAQGIVKRAVTQVVSPAMPFDLEKAGGHDHRYMVSVAIENNFYFLSALDFTTGEFLGFKLSSFEDFIETLRLISPKEMVSFMGQFEDPTQEETLKVIVENSGILKTLLSEEYFKKEFTEIYIEKLIPGFKRDKILNEERAILNAIGALSYYITSTQKIENFVHIRPFKLIGEQGVFKVTLPTLIGLEILPKSRETYAQSLLGFFDKTFTAMGARKLKTFFTTPLKNLNEILERQNIIENFIKHTETRNKLKDQLAKIRDIERILAKLSMGKALSSDLINLAIAINSYHEIQNELKTIKLKSPIAKNDFQNLLDLSKNILDTLNDEIGASLEKGNLIKLGVNKTRDKLVKLHTNVADELIEMENRLKEKTGILKLRIKSNNVNGFFIEVSKGSTHKVPKDFERRQTLVNAERYTTKELEELEKETISAKDKLERLEREIFNNLIEQASHLSGHILKMSDHIAILDAFLSFSIVAINENFSKPNLHPDKKILNIKNGFHPLIKANIKDQFVCHDILLDESVFFGLITGPNMAGKTTVMREVAIIQLLAQIGSFVPCEKADLSLCDYLFSRLGASDDILKGHSTFMVEMAETAEILRHATDRSLIILDEVGRGTSTYDGLSIAWSLVEHFISNVKAITLFATHYHELIELAEKNPNAKNLTVETVNHKGNVQFLYRLIEKGASQSFGIYVAKLSGIPHNVLKRAEAILSNLEEHHQIKINDDEESPKGSQLSFFENDGENQIKIPEYLKNVEEEIAKLDISKMTPLDALIKLNSIKNQIDLH